MSERDRTTDDVAASVEDAVYLAISSYGIGSFTRKAIAKAAGVTAKIIVDALGERLKALENRK